LKILIVDGHAYAYRAFYAIRSLSSPGGKPTNAIYGFIKMLGKMRATVNPSHVIVVWDGGLSAERREALPGYKAQRPEMPADLGSQLDEIMGYLGAANIASYCADGVEADDYIAFLTQAAAKAGMEVVIASADKDFMQLVTPECGVQSADCGVAGAMCDDSALRIPNSAMGKVGLLNPNDKSEMIWTAEQVRVKTGVEPEQIGDWLSLLGDSVDNIPGVPGVGPKTATDLLKQFGSVAELYRRLDEVKSERIRDALKTAEADVRRNQSLVRLKTEVGSEFSADALVARPADAGRLMELYRGWGFRSMLAELESAQTRQQELI
jgi:DNA polymerase-1